MFKQASKRTIRRHIAQEVAEIWREVTEEVNMCTYKRKKVDDEYVEGALVEHTWMDVFEDTYDTSIWSTDGKVDDMLSCDEEDSSADSWLPSQTSVRESVWEWVIQMNVPKIHLRSIRGIFISLVLDMPKDPCTLLGVSYNFRVESMSSGEYVHIGPESKIKRLLENDKMHKSENENVVNLPIDGLPVFRKTKVKFWPI
uniref:Uncharacterized protein n=1 Tax=Schistocephalus solidus TaxID=70667 RepID=A0A0X3NU56_SCHSO